MIATANVIGRVGRLEAKTSKKTRRYIIQTEDVIDFLEKRDRGAVPTRRALHRRTPSPRWRKSGCNWRPICSPGEKSSAAI
jgi:hypothetical protein